MDVDTTKEVVIFLRMQALCHLFDGEGIEFFKTTKIRMFDAYDVTKGWIPRIGIVIH